MCTGKQCGTRGRRPAETRDSTSCSDGLTGHEVFDVSGLQDDMQPNAELGVRAVKKDGSQVAFNVITRLDTIVDIEYFRNGGILHTVIRSML